MDTRNTKEEKLNEIIQDIFSIDSLKIDDSRKLQIRDFIISAVNGDNPTAHLAINVKLGENKNGIIAYILTNLRLIKIDIDEKELQSSSFPLDTIIGIERKLIDGGERAAFSISFQNGSFGLKYSPLEQKITEFFQKIDHSRTSKNGQ